MDVQPLVNHRSSVKCGKAAVRQMSDVSCRLLSFSLAARLVACSECLLSGFCLCSELARVHKSYFRVFQLVSVSDFLGEGPSLAVEKTIKDCRLFFPRTDHTAGSVGKGGAPFQRFSTRFTFRIRFLLAPLPHLKPALCDAN